MIQQFFKYNDLATQTDAYGYYVLMHIHIVEWLHYKTI